MTAPALIEKGAKLFTWLHPGELLQEEAQVGRAMEEKPECAPRHGAFVYLFREDLKPDPRDVLFPIWESMTLADSHLRTKVEDNEDDDYDGDEDEEIGELQARPGGALPSLAPARDASRTLMRQTRRSVW